MPIPEPPLRFRSIVVGTNPGTPQLAVYATPELWKDIAEHC
jgi:hypothetical protein